MKYLIISDSHGYQENIREIMKRLEEPVEAVFHLGDIEGMFREIENIVKVPLIAVAGNNDWSGDLQNSRVVVRQGHRIAMTHGHRHGVYFSMDSLIYFGQQNEAELVLFGHTHVPYLDSQCGILLHNPGSISLPRQENRLPSYSLMEIRDDGEIRIEQKYADWEQ